MSVVAFIINGPPIRRRGDRHEQQQQQVVLAASGLVPADDDDDHRLSRPPPRWWSSCGVWLPLLLEGLCQAEDGVPLQLLHALQHLQQQPSQPQHQEEEEEARLSPPFLPVCLPSYSPLIQGMHSLPLLRAPGEGGGSLSPPPALLLPPSLWLWASHLGGLVS